MDIAKLVVENRGTIYGETVRKMISKEETIEIQCIFNTFPSAFLNTILPKNGYIEWAYFDSTHVIIKKPAFFDSCCGKIKIANIIYLKIIYPVHFFGRLDFECNGLIIDNVEMVPKLCHQLIHCRSIDKIISDIYQKIAVIYHHKPKNIKNMMSQVWDIIDRKFYIPNNTLEGDECLLCLHPITADNHLKRTCCNANYHKKCAEKILTQCVLCPHCRNSL